MLELEKQIQKIIPGKFLIYDNWDHSKQRNIQLSKSIKVNRFNPSKEVIEKQIRQDAKDYFQEYGTIKQKKINVQDEKIEDLIQYYKGQILHVKGDTHYKYALSDVKMIENDCLFEYNSQVFRRNGAINGFLNTKILVTPPAKDEDARKAFKKNIEKTKGAVNAGALQWFEMAKMPEDITKAIAVMDLTSAPNDKIFEYSDKQAEKEICKAFNVPLMLVSQTDNSLFGSSGEMLKEAKIQLWEIKEEERQLIENTFSKLMNLFASDKKVNEKLIIENPLSKHSKLIIMATLITVQEFSDYRNISVKKDTDYIKECIELAQQSDLIRILGDFYFDVVANESENDYQDLLNGSTFSYCNDEFEHKGIKALLADYAFARYSLNRNINDTAFGMVTKKMDHSEPIDYNTLKQISIQAQQDAGIKFKYIEKYILSEPDLFSRYCKGDKPDTGFNEWKMSVI